jgi:hypothetical protein
MGDTPIIRFPKKSIGVWARAERHKENSEFESSGCMSDINVIPLGKPFTEKDADQSLVEDLYAEDSNDKRPKPSVTFSDAIGNTWLSSKIIDEHTQVLLQYTKTEK